MSPENRKPDDHELDAFLAGEGEVSREYRRLDRVSAPAALDDAVLRLAREAAALPRPVPAAVRWRVPLALAATVLLSLGTLRLMQEDPTAQRELAFHDSAPMVAAAPPAIAAEHAPLPSSAPSAQSEFRVRAAKPVLPAPATAPPSAPAKREAAPAPAPPEAQPDTAQLAQAEAESLQRREQASSQRSMAKRQAFAAAAAPEPMMNRTAPAAAGSMATESVADAVPDHADALPACPPPQPETCEASAAALETCFACVRRLRDRGELEPARALMRELRSRAQARGETDDAVPEDLKALETTP